MPGEARALVDTNVLLHAADQPDDAWADLEKLRLTLEVLKVPDDLTQRVLELGKTVAVRRAEVFDLAIAASTLAAGLDTIYTYDPKVFARVPGLTVKEPQPSAADVPAMGGQVGRSRRAFLAPEDLATSAS